MNDSKVLSSEKLHSWLEDIFTRIGKDEAAELHKELDEVFMYKPVDPHYFLVRGQLYLQEKRYQEAELTIASKENWWMPSPYAPLMAELLYNIRRSCYSEEEVKNIKIAAYYTYTAAVAGSRTGRKIFFHEEFIRAAKRQYEEETARIQKLIQDIAYAGYEENNLLENGKQLYNHYYSLHRHLQYTIIETALSARNQTLKDEKFKQFLNVVIKNEPNINFLIREMLNKADTNDLFAFIMTDENQKAEFLTLAGYLKCMGRECIILEKPVTVDLEYMVEIKDTVEISMMNREVIEDVTIIYPCEFYLEGKYVGNNIAEIIKFLNNTGKDEFINIIAERKIFTEQKYNCLSEYKGQFSKGELCFGYAGSYTAYVSRIYAYDYRDSLEAKDQCLFSIVIPARNSAYTLQYTLKTCLKQRRIERDEYEIIISDNSSGGSREIERLIEDINDSRIKYFKTPLDLPLAKSFEFAYGKARGKYIIPMGSDDGLLPWSLETLKEIVDKNPQVNIIGWERGLFQWTESESRQRGKFIIPSFYKKGEYNEEMYNSLRCLKREMDKDSEYIFSMPLLYINSLFKRTFLQELLIQTGGIVDGYTQDFGMGIKSMLFCKEFLYIKYPITIAGMSDGSLGTKMVQVAKDDAEAKTRLEEETERGVGIAVIDSEFPFCTIASREGMFWAEIFRLRKVQLCNLKISLLLEDHDWKETLNNITFKRNLRDVDYFYHMEKLRYNAYGINEDLGRWYESAIYDTMLYKIDRRILEEPREEKYKTGFDSPEGMTLDASKFNVMNIEGAVELFANIVNL